VNKNCDSDGWKETIVSYAIDFRDATDVRAVDDCEKGSCSFLTGESGFARSLSIYSNCSLIIFAFSAPNTYSSVIIFILS